MSEEPLESNEHLLKPVEVQFGDIVQSPINSDVLGKPGVIVGLSEHELIIDDLVRGEDGVDCIVPTAGTHYGAVQVTGHFEGGADRIIEQSMPYWERFKLPKDIIDEAVAGHKAAEAKGTITYTGTARTMTPGDLEELMKRHVADNAGQEQDNTQE